VSERDLDVVVLGATGVTGRRVVAYLADRAGSTGARWAAAARDKAKLERVLAEDGVDLPEMIQADVSDPESLSAMASRTRVVLNAVGPYTLYGRPVIEACAGAGTHYADLTGEIPFVREIVTDFDERAAASGAKIVQVCGFESLPPDLGVALATQSARERFDDGLADVELRATLYLRPPGLPRPSDGISGGTSQSAAATLTHPDAAMVTDPAALIFEDDLAAQIRRISPISTRPRSIGDGGVLAPMVPAAFINPAVIHRTARLSGTAPFRYREGIVLDGRRASLPLRYALAGALAGFQVALARLARASTPTRQRAARGLSRILPSSGVGPDASRLENWGWRMSIDGRTNNGQRVGVEIDGRGHPGYLATAKMFGEAGLLLAEPGATPDRAGCITPATALGTDRIDRFAHADLRFRVLD
jgi:short subunit dehydrogenase-like uncharacterized protein